MSSKDNGLHVDAALEFSGSPGLLGSRNEATKQKYKKK